MKRVALIMIALWISIMPIHGQEDDGYCREDRLDLIALAQAVADADGDDAIIDAIADLRERLITDVLICAGAGAPNGHTRLNPVPIGDSYPAIIADSLVSITVLNRRQMTNDDIRIISSRNDDLVRSGNVATDVVLEITCLEEAVNICGFYGGDFRLVGSSGIIREDHYMSVFETSVSMFGGGTVTYLAIFEVPEDETDFVLIVGDDDDMVFFETP